MAMPKYIETSWFKTLRNLKCPKYISKSIKRQPNNIIDKQVLLSFWLYNSLDDYMWIIPGRNRIISPGLAKTRQK